MNDKIKTVNGTITLADGTISEFSLAADLGWTQWGANTPRLGRTVDAVEAMRVALEEFWMDANEMDEPDVEVQP